jgi:dethiobiotin synthetase
VAPAAAAESDARAISLPSILSAADRLRDAGDYLVTESAGGLLTPYSDLLTAADIAAALRLPVLLVARNGLGTINHTALAINELQRRALPLAGVVLVDTTPDSSPDRASNAHLIARMTGTQPLGVLPHLAHPTPDALANALAAFFPESLL